MTNEKSVLPTSVTRWKSKPAKSAPVVHYDVYPPEVDSDSTYGDPYTITYLDSTHQGK